MENKGTVKCSACLGKIKEDESLDCSNCHTSFHHLCLRIDALEFNRLTPIQKAGWTCPKCHRATKRGTNQNTPVRNSLTAGDEEASADIDMQSPGSWITHRNKKQNFNQSVTMFQSGSEQHQCLTKEDIREVVQAELRSVLSTDIAKILDRSISTNLQAIRTEISGLKGDISTVKESMEFINHQFEEIKKDTYNTSQECKILSKKVEALQATNKELNYRVAQIEQHSRASNIEIQCLPEHRSENLVTVIMQLTQIVSCAIKEDDIHQCTRTAKLDAASSRPRSVVVQMKSPLVRDRLLASVMKFNKSQSRQEDKLNSSHLGIGGQKEPIYVVEHLSPHNRELHKAARKAAKVKQYKFVWIKNGRIFVRKDEAAQAIVLKDLDSVNRLL